jgi:hypothetical protein
MGISIMAGAITTLGSGLFLMPCTIIVFNKFGVIISSTVIFSFFYASMLFGSMVHMCGVEGKQGDILACC